MLIIQKAQQAYQNGRKAKANDNPGNSPFGSVPCDIDYILDRFWWDGWSGRDFDNGQGIELLDPNGLTAREDLLTTN